MGAGGVSTRGEVTSKYGVLNCKMHFAMIEGYQNMSHRTTKASAIIHRKWL